MRKLLFLFIGSLAFYSCYYDVEEELYPDGCPTDNVTYSEVIQPILNNNCYVCHASSLQLGGVDLEQFDSLKKWVNKGILLLAVKHEGNVEPMPQGGPKLPDCTILRIETWINNGALND